MCLHIDAQSGQSQSNSISFGFGNRPELRSVTTAITWSDKCPRSSSSKEPMRPAQRFRTAVQVLFPRGRMRTSTLYISEPLTSASTLPLRTARWQTDPFRTYVRPRGMRLL